MEKEILAELRKIEQDLAKLSKLKPTTTTQQRKMKLSRRRTALQAKLPKPPAPKAPEKPKVSAPKKTPGKTITKTSVTAKTPAQAKPSQPKIKYQAPKKEKVKKEKKEKTDNKQAKPKEKRKNPKSKKARQKKKKESIEKKKGSKTKRKPVVVSIPEPIPFGTVPDTGELKPAKPMSLIGTYVTAMIDRIYEALEGRSELVTLDDKTAEYNGSYISLRSYYYRLGVASRATVLIKICEEAEKEVELINANDEGALKAYEEGTLISNILVSKSSEILERLFRWVFDSDQKEDALSDIDALFPFTEAFGGTKYQKELETTLDEVTNEDMSGGIEREEYNPKDTFIGYITGREYVILPDGAIQAVSDELITFEKGSDGLYEIGSKKYTLREAIERL